jgi:hypothetical protein
MWTHEGIIFRAEYLTLFSVASLVAIVSAVGGHAWESRELWSVAVIAVMVAINAIDKIRNLPELVELRGIDLFVQSTRHGSNQFDLDSVRELVVAESNATFRFKERRDEIKLTLTKKAADILTSRLLERFFDFALWSHNHGNVVYLPKDEWPPTDVQIMMRNLQCAACGQRRPSRYWFQDEWGRPVPECKDCQEARKGV